MEKIIAGLIGIAILVVALPIQAYAHSPLLVKAVIKTWSMVGNGVICVYNFEDDRKCKYFTTTYKDKVYKTVYFKLPKGFVDYKEIYKVCVTLQETYSDGTFWSDCIIDQRNSDKEELPLTLTAYSKHESKNYLGLP